MKSDENNLNKVSQCLSKKNKLNLIIYLFWRSDYLLSNDLRSSTFLNFKSQIFLIFSKRLFENNTHSK